MCNEKFEKKENGGINKCSPSKELKSQMGKRKWHYSRERCATPILQNIETEKTSELYSTAIPRPTCTADEPLLPQWCSSCCHFTIYLTEYYAFPIAYLKCCFTTCYHFFYHLNDHDAHPAPMATSSYSQNICHTAWQL